MMRLSPRLVLMLAVGAVVTVLPACGSDDEAVEEPEPNVRAAVYVGAVASSGDRIAFDLARPDVDGLQRVKAFVADGTPDGDAEWFEGSARRGVLELTSVSGKARLKGEVADMRLDGAITLPDGVERPFQAVHDAEGGGIYRVTVTPEGRFSGISESGAQLVGQRSGIFVEGSVTTTRGDRFEYRDADMTRPFQTSAPGTPGTPPGTYTVIVGCSGRRQVGRGGAVDQGVADANVVNLDLASSTVNTPGVWYGRVAGGADQFVMLVGEPDPAGLRKVSVLLSDGEPGPDGDGQWFAGDVAGDRFNLTSASKNATMAGQISPVASAGEVALPGDPPRAFFALPAGDGAGIYDVSVSPDKHYDGRSEQGGRLTLAPAGDRVNGVIHTTDGRELPLTAFNMAEVFGFPGGGSVPGTYLTLVAPSGRAVLGRSGDVRGGIPGSDAIGLGEAC